MKNRRLNVTDFAVFLFAEIDDAKLPITMAARSVPANLAEGYSRRETSKTTQFRLIDVARASISELSSDLFYQSMRLNIPLWNKDHPYFERARTLGIPQPSYGTWWLADSQKFLLEQIERMRPWLANDSVEFSLNVLLIICERLKLMIEKSLNQLHQEFLIEGGFTEKLTSERLEAKNEQAQDSPRCPICNGPMQRKVARKGGNHGNPFWSCCQYPRCTGTRPWSYN